MYQLNLRKLSASSSTNKELKDLLRLNNLKSGDGVWTLNQTDGFGQLGSVWEGEANSHLAFSLYKKFEDLNPKWIYSINCASALAVLKTLTHFNVPNLSIKWPNDILSGNKKICGILAENQIKSNEIKSIIGIGINLYEKTFLKLPNATSVYIETQKKLSLDFFIDKLSKNLIIHTAMCTNSLAESLSKMFNEKLYFFKQKILFEINGELVNARINKVHINGLLELEFKNREIKSFQPKEIKMIY